LQEFDVFELKVKNDHLAEVNEKLKGLQQNTVEKLDTKRARTGSSRLNVSAPTLAQSIGNAAPQPTTSSAFKEKERKRRERNDHEVARAERVAPEKEEEKRKLPEAVLPPVNLIEIEGPASAPSAAGPPEETSNLDSSVPHTITLVEAPTTPRNEESGSTTPVRPLTTEKQTEAAPKKSAASPAQPRKMKPHAPQRRPPAPKKPASQQKRRMKK
jgi:hypothetical protein